MTRVKVCGIMEPAHALVAADQGADFVGMVFVRSPRFVVLERGREIMRKVQEWRRHYASPSNGPSAGVLDRYSGPLAEAAAKLEALLGQRRPLLVGVFADRPIHELNNIVVYCGIDVVQLSGEEPWEYCERLTRPVLKVVKVRPGDTAESVIAMVKAGAEQLLRRGGICIIEPYVRQRYGGTGQSMDWALAAQVAEEVPIMLAGGLTPENVGEAVQRVRPWGVDVSSGVETGQRKDEAKIAAFIAAARGVAV
jgi:phosphoribosylanthranilate isomerase